MGVPPPGVRPTKNHFYSNVSQCRYTIQLQFYLHAPLRDWLKKNPRTLPSNQKFNKTSRDLHTFSRALRWPYMYEQQQKLLFHPGVRNNLLQCYRLKMIGVLATQNNVGVKNVWRFDWSSRFLCPM